ncbi:MAG: NBR1-Ig-like domain-containing protein [Anaerolineaceae bacterium]
MKKYAIGIVFLISCLLSSCTKATSTEPGGSSLDTMHTEVAATLTKQVTNIPPTVTLPPDFTATIRNTITLFPTLTPMEITNTPVARENITPKPCDNAAYVSDVTIPDGSIMKPGEIFTKTWKIQNTGTCDWTTSYSIIFSYGNELDGGTTRIPSPVRSGNVGDISVNMVAPTTPGTYTGYWLMRNEVGDTFGEYVFVKIIVSGKTSTPEE